MSGSCAYRKTSSDGYGTNWRTACGHRVRCEAPIEVGMSFAPLPNADGAIYCPYCGKLIELKERK